MWPFQLVCAFILHTEAESLQLKTHPFICMRNFMNKKVGKQKNTETVYKTNGLYWTLKGPVCR